MHYPFSRTELKRLTALAIAAAFATMIMYSQVPMSQSGLHHQFADNRTVFGVSNFWNVISNIPFVILGLIGLVQLWQRKQTSNTSDQSETAAWSCFFGAVILAGFGSAWYHLSPGNENLVLSRLPIAMGVMGLFAAMIAERISHQAYRLLIWPMVCLGLASVLSWYVSELRETSDPRFYYLVLFFPLLMTPIMMALNSPKYTHGIYINFAIVTLAIAKACDHFDSDIFLMTGWLSGHVLSHLFVAIGCWFLVIMTNTRQRI